MSSVFPREEREASYSILVYDLAARLKLDSEASCESFYEGSVSLAWCKLQRLTAAQVIG